jgi:hypothetical protein
MDFCHEELRNITEQLNYSDPWRDPLTKQAPNCPEPRLFEGVGCTKKRRNFQSLSALQTEELPLSVLTSLLIPPFWQIKLYSKNTTLAPLLLPLPQAPWVLPQTRIISTLADFRYATNHPVFVPGTPGKSETLRDDNVFGGVRLVITPDVPDQWDVRLVVRIFHPPEVSGTEDIAKRWMYHRCMNRLPTQLGYQALTTWMPGTDECDHFMTSWCESEQGGVRVGEECACLRNEAQLRQQFCLPIPADLAQKYWYREYPLVGCGTTTSTPRAVIPVTCMGRECSSGRGYRWSRMQNQRCDMTLCLQNTTIQGTSIDVTSKQDLWCGTQPIPSAGTPTPFLQNPIPSLAPKTTHPLALPLPVWVALGCVVLLLCIMAPLMWYVLDWNHALKRFGLALQQKKSPLETSTVEDS